MKNVIITAVVAVVAAAAGVFAAMQAPAGGAEEAKIEAVVAEYVKENGEALAESINLYATKAQISAANELIRDYTPVSGPEDAKVTLIEFSDFECPFCSRVQDTMSEIRAEYGDKVRFVFKHYPLPFHAKATGASAAAQAAHMQGKFWEYSSKLWENQDKYGDKLYVEIAEGLGLDMDKFNADRNSEEVKNIVVKDMEDGQLAGVRGTPFFLVNGEAISGALPKEAFDQVLKAAFEQAEELGL